MNDNIECNPRIACRSRTDGHWEAVHAAWTLDYAAGYKQGWDDCQKAVAAQQGMRLSRDATDTQRNAVNVTMPRSGTKGAALWELFLDANKVTGLTDDEIERKTGWSHQSASAARNALMRRGLLKDSGKRRNNRRGLPCIVWVRVSPERSEPDDRRNDPDPSPDGTYPGSTGDETVLLHLQKYGELW